MGLDEVRRSLRTYARPRAYREIQRRNRIELFCDDVVSAQLRVADQQRVQGRWQRPAEVPAFSRAPVMWCTGGEERSEILHGIRLLVVSKQRRSAAATIRIGAEKDVHLRLADVIVHVAPVRVADVPKTICSSLADGRVGEANGVRVVWRRKCKRTRGTT